MHFDKSKIHNSATLAAYYLHILATGTHARCHPKTLNGNFINVDLD